MIGIRPKFKMVFFDRSVIRTNWGKINNGPAKKAGLYIKKLARQSIKRGRPTKTLQRRPSRPGKPPKSWKKGATPPFKMIYSLPQGNAQVVVGMVGFGGTSDPVPGLHEHSGKARRKVYPRSKNSVGGKRLRINVTARYPKRPFMLPALKKGAPKLPLMWKGSLSK